MKLKHKKYSLKKRMNTSKTTTEDQSEAKYMNSIFYRFHSLYMVSNKTNNKNWIHDVLFRLPPHCPLRNTSFRSFRITSLLIIQFFSSASVFDIRDLILSTHPLWMDPRADTRYTYNMMTEEMNTTRFMHIILITRALLGRDAQALNFIQLNKFSFSSLHAATIFHRIYSVRCNYYA